MKEDKCVCDVMKQNYELQKQVDELLNRRIEPKIFYYHADALETCPKVKQSAKDTAKEILQGLENMSNNGVYQGKLTVPQMRIFFKEHYGVEVEE